MENQVTQTPSLIVHPHALTGDGREVFVAGFLDGETLGDYVKRTGVIVPAGPVAVWHNGHRVPDKLWKRLIPRNGDQVIIRARVLGGGGGGGKVLQTVAMLALVVTAAYFGPAVGAFFGATGATAAALGSGLIMIGGSLLVNALLPPPKPSFDAPGRLNQKYETSPTYQIAGGRNRARQWEVMPLVFGRHKVVPDYAANYYTEYVGDDQYLRQAFHFGLQADSVAITDMRIGDTPISNYQGIQVQTSGGDGRLSMIPGNVDTIQGFTLQSGVINTRTTAPDVVHIRVEIAAQLFYVRDDGGIDGRTVQYRIQWRPVGGAWNDIGLIQDPIYASHYWSLERTTYDDWYGYSTQQVQYGSTNYGDHYDGEQVIIDYNYWGDPIYGTWRWKPHPHTYGEPWYGIAPDPLIGYSSTPGIRLYGARQEPTRTVIQWAVSKGQYEIRVWKESGDIKSSRESNEMAVSQILAYQTDEADYTGQLRLAMSIKATGQLNGVVDEFNAVAIAYCPVWNGSSWVWAHTSNPAWWFLWFARGRIINGERAYGAGLADAQIDIEAIKAWGAFCDAKSLTFNWVLDRKMSCADVLQIIARAGRASPTWQTGKLGVVWDQANLPVVAMFGPFNIKAGSFSVDYINDGSVDEIVMNFVNPSREWQVDEVRVSVPGAVQKNNPLQLDLEGCTDAGMAGREANLMAASQVWHRRRTSWETDIEGWVAGRGDVVQISHDLTVWGYSGRLYDRTGNTITLDKFVPSDGAGTLMIRDPDGNMRTVSVTSVVGDVDSLTITNDMTGFALPGDYPDVPAIDWAWFFDPLETPGRRFKIVSVEPTQDGVKFQAVDDDPQYYASENNPYAYTPPRDGALLAGVILSIDATEKIVNAIADVNDLTFSWVSSSDGKFDVAYTINGLPRPSIRTENSDLTIQAKTGDVIVITITPVRINGLKGTPSTLTYKVVGLKAPLPAVTGLTNVFRDGLTVLRWDRVSDIRNPDYEIRIGPSWADGRTVASTREAEALAVGNGLYWVAARFVGNGYTIYGPPDSLSISGAVLVRNVLEVTQEHPAWGGYFTDGAVKFGDLLTLNALGDILSEGDVLGLTDVLFYGGVASYGTYETNTANIIDIGYVTPVRVDFEIDDYAIDVQENFLAYPDVLAEQDVLNGSNRQFYNATPQIRTAGDDGVFGAWVDYVPGLINARYFDVRLVLETRNQNIVPFVQAFTWTIDVPDLIQKAEKVIVPDTGLRVDYLKAFHVDPNVQIAIFDAIEGDFYVLTNSDETGFNISMFNNSTQVQRTINWISQGY